MKDAYLAKQNNRDAATFPFGNVGAKFDEQSFNVSPLNVSAGWPREDQFKGALALPLHAEDGTTKKYRCQQRNFRRPNDPWN